MSLSVCDLLWLPQAELLSLRRFYCPLYRPSLRLLSHCSMLFTCPSPSEAGTAWRAGTQPRSPTSVFPTPHIVSGTERGLSKCAMNWTGLMPIVYFGSKTPAHAFFGLKSCDIYNSWRKTHTPGFWKWYPNFLSIANYLTGSQFRYHGSLPQ